MGSRVSRCARGGDGRTARPRGRKRRIARVFEIWAVGAGGRVEVVFVSSAVRGDALVVDDLLEVPHRHGRPSKVVQLALFLLRALGMRLDPLLVRHELLLHEQPVLDALELELTQHALARRGDVRQAVSTVHALLLHLLANARGEARGAATSSSPASSSCHPPPRGNPCQTGSAPWRRSLRRTRPLALPPMRRAEASVPAATTKMRRFLRDPRAAF